MWNKYTEYASGEWMKYAKNTGIGRIALALWSEYPLRKDILDDRGKLAFFS